MCAIAFSGRAAWPFSARLNSAAVAADAAAPASPLKKMRLSAPNSANDLASAATVATGFAARALTLAVALRADIFAGAGRSRLRFVAGVEGFRLVVFQCHFSCKPQSKRRTGRESDPFSRKRVLTPFSV